VECFVDRGRFTQVLRNLLENAVAACPGPVLIDIAWTRIRLRGQETLRITVRDNGPGFTAKQRQKAFEPFYTTKSEGTGLGLAISKRIVQAHDGHIHIAPQRCKGAKIEITLPTLVNVSLPKLVAERA
jgi:signal transduction histidine kinase